MYSLEKCWDDSYESYSNDIFYMCRCSQYMKIYIQYVPNLTQQCKFILGIIRFINKKKYYCKQHKEFTIYKIEDLKP